MAIDPPFRAYLRGGNAVRRLWDGWKRIGKQVADVQSRLILSIFYFAVIAPFGLGIRWWADPLAIKPSTAKGWRPRPPGARITLERAREQF